MTSCWVSSLLRPGFARRAAHEERPGGNQHEFETDAVAQVHRLRGLEADARRVVGDGLLPVPVSRLAVSGSGPGFPAPRAPTAAITARIVRYFLIMNKGTFFVE